MKNAPLILSLAVLTSAALTSAARADSAAPAPVHHTQKHHHAFAKRHAALAPIEAPKPAPAPSVAQNTAPMPNESVTAPVDNSDQETSVAPSVMQIHYPPMGDGYTNGSSAQAMDDREAAKVTGVQIKVPLGQ